MVGTMVRSAVAHSCDLMMNTQSMSRICEPTKHRILAGFSLSTRRAQRGSACAHITGRCSAAPQSFQHAAAVSAVILSLGSFCVNAFGRTRHEIGSRCRGGRLALVGLLPGRLNLSDYQKAHAAL